MHEKALDLHPTLGSGEGTRDTEASKKQCPYCCPHRTFLTLGTHLSLLPWAPPEGHSAQLSCCPVALCSGSPGASP